MRKRKRSLENNCDKKSWLRKKRIKREKRKSGVKDLKNIFHRRYGEAMSKKDKLPREEKLCGMSYRP